MEAIPTKTLTKTQVRRREREQNIIGDWLVMYDPNNPKDKPVHIIGHIADRNGVSYSTAYNLIANYRKSI